MMKRVTKIEKLIAGIIDRREMEDHERE